MATITTPAEFAAALTEKFASPEFQYTNRKFGVSPGGQKYIRITQETEDRFGSLSVHCFVERATGHVFKASGWKAPAKGVRFTTMDEALAAADVYGSYLYKR